MAKNNRVKITQSKTYSFKIEDILFVEKRAKELQKSSAQVLAMAIDTLRETSTEIVQDDTSEQRYITERG